MLHLNEVFVPHWFRGNHVLLLLRVLNEMRLRDHHCWVWRGVDWRRELGVVHLSLVRGLVRSLFVVNGQVDNVFESLA
jgi:hypothetical protein